jgi:hypothetical protein
LERDRYDILSFSGAWELGKDKKLIYRYLSSDLKAGRRRVHSLEFNGHWDIRKKYRISYMLGADTESAFDFRTGAGVYGRDYIRYEVGIGLSGRARPVERTIEIFGRWFVREGVGVVFEVKYAGHRTRAIVFGADAKLTGKDTVRLRLKTAEGNKDIGATVELSHRMLRGDGEAFLRALASRRELALYAGAAWRW